MVMSPAIRRPTTRNASTVAPSIAIRPIQLKSLTQSVATMTAIAAVLALPRVARAEPTGGSVVAGSAGITQSGPVTNINQSSNKAIINWQTFSVGAKETVNFNQPST